MNYLSAFLNNLFAIVGLIGWLALMTIVFNVTTVVVVTLLAVTYLATRLQLEKT